ncbi:prolyl oligopeptidase family serine peptidase [Oscillatoria sp. FACHB-1406]|uniref:S9 family peptidase n=1 Tax=Oscillatoria sp. FACHB-1406 TaxID=2692846 RepID=UPI001684A11C|nr:prolyl oligopeptidase family serine peptidase [Oscillatoria sp. FACHB-1406]MBD2578697.1 prolyl oligopeptidase family serine peptidase [Oscillatoria sp. FACHB-1406]
MPLERTWETWQSPPEPIARILDAALPPAVTISPNHRWFVMVERTYLLPASELAAPKLAIAGLQIDPQVYAPSGRSGFRNLTYRSLESPETIQTPDLPENARLSFFEWSHDGDRLAFTLARESGLELWFLDLPSGQTHRLTEPILNATYYNPCRWLPGDEGLICKIVPPNRSAPPESLLLQGPLVEENLGKKAPARTYTNLLKNPHDEALFEHYLSSQVERISLKGERELLVPPMLVDEAIPSPDGRYILLETLQRPFSYQFPLSRFPKRIEVRDRAGNLVYTVADLPLADNIPIQFGSVRAGRRSVFWRSDRAASLAWVEALDGGDAGAKADFRDALFELDAPFDGQPKQLWRSQYRFEGLVWGRDDLALVWEGWYDNRLQRIWRINPQNPLDPPHLWIERNYQDRYSDPGHPLLTLGTQGDMVLRFSPDGDSVYLEGRGASEAGVYPFLDRRSLFGGETERIWQAQDPYYERVEALLDAEARRWVMRRESQTEPPNFFLRDGDNPPIPLTAYSDPAPELARVRKEIIRYHRADGLPLSATLYLPPDYDKERDGSLPALFWVYPEEFKDAITAAQIDAAQNSFSRPYGFSILFLLLQGYAVVDDPVLPIIGENDREPNDTYIEQLLTGAKAAVEEVARRGVIDPNRIAIGGHSYGAFTAANLLAHSDLFRAGIAASGAYNRTLTPFSFQGEQRSFWEARQTYMEMSPFTYADRINEPLLLIHGMDDSNVGTYPLQSERLFEALKGLGATVRWVQLPYEDHGYRGRDSVGHVLWEILQWCGRYL